MRLRPDIQVQLSDDEALLRDPTLAREVRVGRDEKEVLQQLDGRSVDAFTLPPEQVAQGLRVFLRLNLIEGAGAAMVERVRSLRRGEAKLGRLVLADSRFECAASGDCCMSYNFGPLQDEDIARLEALPLAEAFPHLKPPYVYTSEVRGKSMRFLERVENRCCFLLDDCRCGIHAHFGPDAKPGLCRTYPYEHLPTVEGVQVYDKGHCSQFPKTARSGLFLRERIHELVPLMGDPGRLYHPMVMLDAELAVDYGYVQPLLSAMVDDLERPLAAPPEMLRAWGRRTRALRLALEDCPIEPDGPVRVAQEVLERGLAPFLGPPEPEALGRAAASFGDLAYEFVNHMMLPINVEHIHANPLAAGRMAMELLPILHFLQELTAHLADPTQPLTEHAQKVASVAVEDADVDEVLRLSLRNQLFGQDALLDGRTSAGQVRLALVQLLALWGARVRAAADGRDRISADDLGRPHMLAMRITDWQSTRRMCCDEEGRAAVLLEGLPLLARWRPL